MDYIRIMYFCIMTAYGLSCTSNADKKSSINGDENILVDVAEQASIAIVPNYRNNIPKDKLLLLTRYIGDEFIENGISKDHSGVVNDKRNISMVINTKELEAKGIYTPITGGGPHI